MTIAYVQSGTLYTNNTAPAITSVTAGNTLVLYAAWSSATSTISGITDSAGGTWQSTTLSSVSGTVYAQIWYLTGAAAGTHTLSITWTTGPSSVTRILEFSGVGALDTQGQNNNAGAASITSQSLTPAQAGDLFLALMAEPGVASNDAITDPPSGWTSAMVEQAGFSYLGCEGCYLIATDALAKSATWTIGGGTPSNNVATIVAFKSAVSPGIPIYYVT